MEDIRIKENRKKKFLSKIQNQEQNYKKINNESPLINNITPIPDNETIINKKEMSGSVGETNTHIEEKINNNEIINNDSNIKIDYDLIYKKVKKYEYIKSILNIIKKIFIIILSIFHCLNYYGLDEISTFKYTLLIFGISSLILDQIFYYKIKNLNKIFIKNDKSSEFESKLPFIQYLNLLNKTLGNLKFIEYIFNILIVLEEIFVDIAILFIVNFIFFIINEEDE